MTDTASTDTGSPEPTEPEAPEPIEVVGVPVTIDGVAMAANEGELLIDACERNGIYIPRFCYHPRMKPVGMCRMCLVEVDSGRGPALQPACMLTCTPDMVVDTQSDVTKKAQDGVLEFLLINHPLDCPVCDKGGECPLQDQTMSYGPGESRFVEEKRHKEKPIPISDTVFLDRERCILCDRCTRFAKEVAGDPLIHFQERGNQTEVNTFPDDPFSSYFSGNTVQICPVGALTAKPYRFKARPWDLEEVMSTATVDSVGSRIMVQSSRNEVLRFLGVDIDPVNWGWLSDKERFGFESLNHEARLTGPLMRGSGLNQLDSEGSELVAAPWNIALAAAAEALSSPDPDRIGVIGGARLTNEAQYAWTKLIKGTLGSDNVDAQLGDGLPAGAVLSLPRATIDHACTPGGTVILLGPDPKELLGTLFLRLRHAVVEDNVTLIELTSASTGLSPFAAHTLRPAAGEVDKLAAELMAGRNDPASDTAGVAGADITAAAAAITGPVTVIVGRPSLAEHASPTVAAAFALRAKMPDARFLSALTRGNVHGALDMGMAPGILPGRQTLDAGQPSTWPTAPTVAGMDTDHMLEAAADGRIDTLVLLGADPINDFPDHDLARRALNAVDTVIAVDLFVTDSISVGADIVLAAAAPTEVAGTFTNLEGRVSVLAQKVTPPGTARADWILAAELAFQMGHDLGIESAEDVWAELAQIAPIYEGASLEAIEAAQEDGIVVTGKLAGYEPDAASAVVSDGYGYRLVATRTMYDSGTMLAHCESSSALAPSAELRMAPADFDTLGVPVGGTVVVLSAVGTVSVSAVPDPGLPRGNVAMTTHLASADPFDLIDHREAVTGVRVEVS